ncbi:hypothetical protein HOS99_gp113 [Staphylococcus phage phiSA_BS1]|uniref:Lipoprotein n=2 Tax=Baoshanvirus TaxID=2732969 RepID=A0A2P1MXP7_9CAUD|nr:hypothetical protein HOS99_gp113 [Staphylococcus phage phiSA_BS1]YP_009800035.1 hypothetical protein HOT02_gp195 [Staphylococcus phage phiSA_BS2]AVP40354.1 hypothetical protein [Staphylococcus phage phiSA_BS1]AVR55639.1 hypothetical protein phiSABS2_195 [Staphylococcus phage phiSA_BS2]
MKKLLGSLVVGGVLLLGACGNEEQVSKDDPTKEETQVETKKDDPNVPWWEEEGGQEKLEEVPYEENGATVDTSEEEWVDPNAEQAEEELIEFSGGSYGYEEGEYERWKEGVDRQVEENREKERKFQEKGYYE